MRAALLALLCLTLPGCTAMRGALTVNVPVPVPVACAEPVPERPVMPTDLLRPGVDEFTFTITAQAEIEVREGYSHRLLTALEACRKPITAAQP